MAVNSQGTDERPTSRSIGWSQPRPGTRNRHAPETPSRQLRIPPRPLFLRVQLAGNGTFSRQQSIFATGTVRRATQDSRKIISYLRPHCLSMKRVPTTVPLTTPVRRKNGGSRGHRLFNPRAELFQGPHSAKNGGCGPLDLQLSER